MHHHWSNKGIEYKGGSDSKGSILASVMTLMERKRKSNYLQPVTHQDCTVNNTHTQSWFISVLMVGEVSSFMHCMHKHTLCVNNLYWTRTYCAVHLCLPVNMELLCYTDTQKEGVTGNVGINKSSSSTAENVRELSHTCHLVSLYHNYYYWAHDLAVTSPMFLHQKTAESV